MGDAAKINAMCGTAKATGLGTKLTVFKTQLLYMCLSSAGLAISSSKKAINIANTVTFLNAGIFKSKTTADVAFTATTHDIAANAETVQEACYLVQLAGDGTPSIIKGTTSTGAGTATVPATSTLNTPIGYARVAVAAGSTKFDATSDDLDAGHLTVTYVNLAFNLPSELTAL